MYPWGPGMMGYGYSPWWGIAIMMFWALVLVAGAVLVVWLVRQGGRGIAPPREDRALTVLRERFARGEITAEQFEQMRRTLE